MNLPPPCFFVQVFISESYDPTSHFETAITDVLAMYQRIMGAPLKFDAPSGSAQ